MKGKKLSVLHVRDIVGTAFNLSRAQRMLGLKSDVFVFSDEKLFQPVDFNLGLKKTPNNFVHSVFASPKTFLFLANKAKNYDILHFHGAASFFSGGIDLPLWQALGKKIVLHFHGSDARAAKKHLKPWFKDIETVFVSTPDLAEIVPRAEWIPNPINTRKLKPKKTKNKMPAVLHAPTDRKIKGTRHVLKAVKELKKQGLKFDFRLIENKKNTESLNELKKADIVVDWINPGYGIYGLLSIEAMALGKPVLCSLKKDLVKKYCKNCPIVNVKPGELKKELKKLIENKELRKQIGRKSRKYAVEMHDSLNVAKKVSRGYRK